MHSETRRTIRCVGRFVRDRLQQWRCALRHGHLVRARAIADYLAATQEPKVQLGGGNRHLEGWLTSDLYGRVPIDITRRLPFADNTLAMVYSSHLVEHVDREDFAFFLKEALRVLRPGGLNVVATPSIEQAAAIWYGPEATEERQAPIRERYARIFPDGSLGAARHLNLLMREWGHQFLYDAEEMRAMALGAGYGRVEQIGNHEVPDAAVRAYLAGAKPERWDLETMTFVCAKAE